MRPSLRIAKGFKFSELCIAHQRVLAKYEVCQVYILSVVICFVDLQNNWLMSRQFNYEGLNGGGGGGVG